ncbi:O-antigen ligase [Bradyrhizobium sp. GM2.4]
MKRLSDGSNASWTGFLVGALDGLVFLSFLLSMDQTIYYSAVLFLKIAVLVLRGQTPSRASRASIPFIYCVLILETISALINDVGILSTIRVYVFCVNLFVTLTFVSVSYWRGLLFISSIDALLYLAFLETGRISDAYGRYLFFSASHPNLGAELFFSAAFASMLSKTPKLSLLLLPLFFAPTFLMQGRAAEIGILYAVGIVGWKSTKNLSPLARFGTASLVAVVAFGWLMTVDVAALVNKVLLLDNQYRGENTNATGRITYWTSALDVWFSHPLFGAGSDYPTRLGTLQAHNFFLYPLAYYGLLGFSLVLIFVQRLLVVAISGRAAYIAAFVPMLAFNDRFINLNTYPTIMFVYIFYEYAQITLRNKRVGYAPSLVRLRSPKDQSASHAAGTLT